MVATNSSQEIVRYPYFAAQVAEAIVRGESRRGILTCSTCIGMSISGLFDDLDILETWLKTPYDGGRHDISPGLIGEAGEALAGAGSWNPADPMSPENTSLL